MDEWIMGFPFFSFCTTPLITGEGSSVVDQTLQLHVLDKRVHICQRN